MKPWSTYFQNPSFLEASRMMLMNKDLLPLVVQYCGIKAGMSVLDVGCGTGAFDFYLARGTDNVSYTGVDLDELFVAEAAKKAATDSSRNSFSFLRGDACALPFDDNSFDIVVSHTVLTSIPDRQKALAEMQRVAKPGSVVASVTAMSFNYVPHSEGAACAKYSWYRPLRHFETKVKKLYEEVAPLQDYAQGIDPSDLPQAFVSAGFNEVCAYPLGNFFSLSNAATSTHDKERYINLTYNAEISRFDNVFALEAAKNCLSAEEAEEYRTLLKEKRDSLLQNTGENEVWQWQGGATLLVTGINNKNGCKENCTNSEELHPHYKACSPLETVEKIKAILASHGIKTEEHFTNSGVKNLYSVRVTIAGTNIGQNGKGTTPHYALASGYAEFMERLSCGFLLPSSVFALPDTACFSFQEAEQKGGALLKDSLEAIRQQESVFNFMPVDVQSSLEDWSFDAIDGKLRCVPFKEFETGKTEWLAENIFRAYYYTNGSCSGNNQQEAMLQGMCEIAERHAVSRIMKERLCPPDVPPEYFENLPVISDIVDDIKACGYRLLVKDASCGIGLPVVAVALIDPHSGKTQIRFGSHPRFETALERCLTEALQGRNIQSLNDVPCFNAACDKDATGIINRYNFLKTSSGVLPQEFYGQNYSYPFSPFADCPSDIAGQFDFMLALCKKLGWKIYLRDCCFFGFPAYQLLVPAVSMVFDFGAQRLVEKRNLYTLKNVVRNPQNATQEQLDSLLKLCLMKKNFVLENSYAFLADAPVTPKLLDIPLDAQLMAALLYLVKNDAAHAAALLRPYRRNADGSLSKIALLEQMAHLAPLDENKLQILRTVYPALWVDEALAIFESPASALPQLSCPDCTACQYRQQCDMKRLSDCKF